MPSQRTKRMWAHLWALSAQTKAYVRLDGTRMLEDLDAVTEEEKRVAEEALATDGGGDRAGASGDRTAAGGDGPDGDGSGDDRSPFDVDTSYGLRQKVGFVLGPLLFALILLGPTPGEPAGYQGQAVGAVTAWVALWWITEAIPIPAASLLPIPLFALTGALPVADTTPSYGHPLIFLFMGGFFLAMAMQRWDLHRRIALRTIKAVGTTPSRLILGFMIATAFLSMWVSNSATVMMMTPIGLAVIYQTRDLIEETGLDVDTSEGNFTFGTALMLCMAYGASVGGVATLIGTPPNILFAGQAEELFGESVSFFEWMIYGLPISLIGLVAVYIWVTRFALSPKFDELPVGAQTIDAELEKLGAMSKQEKLVLVVFVGMAVAWIGGSLIGQFELATVPDDVDTIVAIGGAMVLFMLPTKTEAGEHTFLLDWTNAVKIPWGVILLFGGGLAIAAGFDQSGLAEWLGGQLELLSGVPMVAVLLAVVTLAIFMTEITSNTGMTAMLMPILAAVGVGIGVHPFGLMIAGATAASFAFMLPVATPPNAIVFGSGYISLPQMARTGFGLNVIGIVLITLVALVWLPIAWGIDLGTLPEAFESAYSSFLMPALTG
ncbi:SLC13 family permease [Natrialbaceae archaeon GCM10025810]|uniref:SLC13 family permease n=1 Tax=Halovalidus salilacus TaxID=3075124 RepID=UPI00362119B5